MGKWKREKSISTKRNSADRPVTESWAVQNASWTDLPRGKLVKISMWEKGERVEAGKKKGREEKHPLQTAAKVSPCLYPLTVLHPLFSFYSGYLPSSLPVPYDLFSLVISESLPLLLSGTPSVISPKYLLPQVHLFHHLPAKQGNDLYFAIVQQWQLHWVLRVWGRMTPMLTYSFCLVIRAVERSSPFDIGISEERCLSFDTLGRTIPSSFQALLLSTCLT